MEVKQSPVAASIPFDNTNNGFESTNVQDAIEEVKGIRRQVVELHYVSGTGGNTTMNNGSFFRTKPGTYASGSFGGYTACFPFLVPFDCKLNNLVLTFTIAKFDWTSTAGEVAWDLEFRYIYHNGSSLQCKYRIHWGNYSGSQIPYGFNTFSLSGNNITLLTGNEELQAGDLIGFRFVKSNNPARNINKFQNILLTLGFEELY